MGVGVVPGQVVALGQPPVGSGLGFCKPAAVLRNCQAQVRRCEREVLQEAADVFYRHKWEFINEQEEAFMDGSVSQLLG